MIRPPPGGAFIHKIIITRTVQPSFSDGQIACSRLRPSSMIYVPALLVTDDIFGSLARPVKACFPGAYLLRRHGLLGMGPRGTISVLCDRLADLLTLSLRLGIGGCTQ